MKAEEIVKEGERRNSVSKNSACREFRPKSYYRTPAQNTSSVPSQQNPQREDNYKTRLHQEPLKNVKCFKCGKKVMLLSLVVLLLIKFVLNNLTRVKT